MVDWLGRWSSFAPRNASSIENQATPHVDGVGTQNGPLKDVSPTEGIATYCSVDFNDKSRNTNSFSQYQSGVDAPQFATGGLGHSSTINRTSRGEGVL